MSATNVGKWDRWYSLVDEPGPYADSSTYRLGAEWLAGCELVEDWGCGKGWLRTLVDPDRYRGIDGSCSPFADEIVDLVDYRSTVPGVFMRHVLEHDVRWAQILDNAVASFTERMALILFTPFAATTRIIGWDDDPHVPNLSFAFTDLTERLTGCEWSAEVVESPATFGHETILRVRR